MQILVLLLLPPILSSSLNVTSSQPSLTSEKPQTITWYTNRIVCYLDLLVTKPYLHKYTTTVKWDKITYTNHCLKSSGSKFACTKFVCSLKNCLLCYFCIDVADCTEFNRKYRCGAICLKTLYHNIIPHHYTVLNTEQYWALNISPHAAIWLSRLISAHHILLTESL